MLKSFKGNLNKLTENNFGRLSIEMASVLHQFSSDQEFEAVICEIIIEHVNKLFFCKTTKPKHLLTNFILR
jgi:hypothetical protein